MAVSCLDSIERCEDTWDLAVSDQVLRRDSANSLRNRDAHGIGTKIVIIDAHRRAIPPAIVLEIADEFSLFGIDPEDGKALAVTPGTQ